MIFKKKRNDELTSLVQKNILGSFFLKGLNMLISLLYVPITLQYLNVTRYGLWMTLTSIVAWIGIFDIGLGNGLRNKLAASLALGDKLQAKKYVSTAYFALGSIVSMILIVFIFANFWINWDSILNTKDVPNAELRILAFIVIASFCLKFVLNIISTILQADQLPALSNIFDLSGNALGLLIVWLLAITEYNSLITFGIAMMVTPVLIYMIGTVFFFNGKYSYLKPSFKLADKVHFKSIMGIGIQFFIVQLTSIVIFETSNILIAQLFSPVQVTTYNVVFKYFSIPSMVWGVIMVTLWSAFTKALAINDIKWIKKTIYKLNQYLFATFLIIILMTLAAPKLISLWTSGAVIVKPLYLIIFSIYSFLFVWNTVYAIFLNGVSKMKIQMIVSVISAIMHIPLSFFFVKHLNMGSEGIVLSMGISLLLFAVAGPIQTFKLIKGWEKKEISQINLN